MSDGLMLFKLRWIISAGELVVNDINVWANEKNLPT
jgi:hypothetical protein